MLDILPKILQALQNIDMERLIWRDRGQYSPLSFVFFNIYVHEN